MTRHRRNSFEHIIKDEWESRRIIDIELFDLLIIERYQGLICSNSEEHKLDDELNYAYNISNYHFKTESIICEYIEILTELIEEVYMY